MRKLITPPVKHLRERVRADGSVRIWWEPNGDLRDLGFETVELDEHRLTWSRRCGQDLNRDAAQARLNGKRQVQITRGRAMLDLIETYKQHRKYTSRSEYTKRSYRSNLGQISKKWGEHPVSQFTKPMMSAWYETLYENSGVHMAGALIGQCSILFKHAERLGWRATGSNPCADLDIETPPPRSRTLSWDEIDQLVAAADALGYHAAGTMILMSFYQGQRQTDIRLTGRDDIRQMTVTDPKTGAREKLWAWTLTRSKRRNDGAMILHPNIVTRIRATLRALDDAATHLLHDEATGKPYSLDLISKRFAKIRARAADTMPGIADVQFRDLRRTHGVMARAGGASIDDIGDLLGNSAATNPLLRETYMPPQFWTASRSVLAISRPPKTKRKKA